MSSPTPPSLSARDLTAFLHAQIPLSRAMEATVVEQNETRLVVEAPLAANVNHLGTAFGGSLHALPTLACYAALWTILREAGMDGHVVIKHSEVHYRQPVNGRLRAICLLPGKAVVAQFMTDLRRNKKARMDLTAIVAGESHKPAVEFSGKFVALV